MFRYHDLGKYFCVITSIFLFYWIVAFMRFDMIVIQAVLTYLLIIVARVAHIFAAVTSNPIAEFVSGLISHRDPFGREVPHLYSLIVSLPQSRTLGKFALRFSMCFSMQISDRFTLNLQNCSYADVRVD